MIPTTKPKFALGWIPPAPPKPETLTFRIVHPEPAKPRRVRPAAEVPDFATLAALDGEPRLYASILFATLGDCNVGIGTDGTLVHDIAATPDQRELAAAAFAHLVRLLTPPAPAPLPWWRRLLRRG